MANFMRRLVREESAQGMAEYGLLVALIALAVIAAITTVGNNLNTKFNNVANQLS